MASHWVLRFRIMRLTGFRMFGGSTQVLDPLLYLFGAGPTFSVEPGSYAPAPAPKAQLAPDFTSQGSVAIPRLMPNLPTPY